MSFTSIALLKNNLGASFVDGFTNGNPGVLDRLIEQTDKLITRKTGKTTPAAPDASQAEIQMCAAWIVHFLMMPFHGGLTTDERDYRRKNYESALEQLSENEMLTNDTTFTVVEAKGTNTKRIGDLP